jgi:putative oxidoreductase
MAINGTSIVPQRVSAALAVLRVVVGIIFVAHGAQKLFTYGLAGVSGSFAGMGVPLPGITGPAVAFLEFFGGIALILGLLTRLTALGLAINMLGAIFMVHLAAGFFLPQGYEFALALFGGSVALALAGAGEYSVDAVIARRRGGATGRV